MIVLGLETSGSAASIAVADEQGVRAELAFRHEMRLSRLLAGRVEETLALAGLRAAQLEGVAACIGPGSFTGLRLGVTAAKTLAYALALPVVGIGSLEALAAEAPVPEGARVWAVLAASASELYAACFRPVGGRRECVDAPALLTAEALADRLAGSPGGTLVVGAPGPHREALARALPAPGALAPEDAAPRAGTVARLGRARLLAGEENAAHSLVPHYARPSAAEARRQEAACRAS